MVRGIIGLTAHDYILWEEKNKHGEKPIDIASDARYCHQAIEVIKWSDIAA